MDLSNEQHPIPDQAELSPEDVKAANIGPHAVVQVDRNREHEGKRSNMMRPLWTLSFSEERHCFFPKNSGGCRAPKLDVRVMLT